MVSEFKAGSKMNLPVTIHHVDSNRDALIEYPWGDRRYVNSTHLKPQPNTLTLAEVQKAFWDKSDNAIWIGIGAALEILVEMGVVTYDPPSNPPSNQTPLR